MYICENECLNIELLNYSLIRYILFTRREENIYVVEEQIVHNRHIGIFNLNVMWKVEE